MPLGSLGCLGIVELRALWRAAIACAIHHHCCAACLHRAWYARCMGGRQTAITAVSRSVLVIVRGVRSDAIPSRDAPSLGSHDCIVSTRALVGLNPHTASSHRLTWQHHTGFPLTSTPARSFPVRQDVLHLRPTTTDLPHPHRIVSLTSRRFQDYPPATFSSSLLPRCFSDDSILCARSKERASLLSGVL